MATAVIMPNRAQGFKAKIDLLMKQVSDRPTRLLLKELLDDFNKMNDYSWMRDEYRLSPAEFKVVELLFQGKSRKDIARDLNISPATVGAHTLSIYKKCRVSRTSELMALVLNSRHS